MTKRARKTISRQISPRFSLTRSSRRFVGVLWLLSWCSARFRGWRLSDRRTWRKGVFSLKHRRCNETKKYHPAQQSPHENDWLPGNENPHGRTSGTKSGSRLPLLYCEKSQSFHEHLASVSSLRSCKREEQRRQETRVASSTEVSGSNRTPPRKVGLQ